MAVKKVARHVLWGTTGVGFQFNNDTTESTASDTIVARLFTKAQAAAGYTTGTKINGTETGQLAGVVVPLTFDLTLVTAGQWYELRIMNDTFTKGFFPNSQTADKIMIYVRPIFV